MTNKSKYNKDKNGEKVLAQFMNKFFYNKLKITNMSRYEYYDTQIECKK